MLEAGLHQGAGLHALTAQPGPRVVVMASHDDRASELPLLCSLCTAWTELGYPVVVLDATSPESVDAPGLQQLLASNGRAEITERAGALWPILPAATGLAQLCGTRPGASMGSSFLQHLGSLFRGYDVVLVYADVQDLARCMPDTGIEPLLAISAKRKSLLSAYQALKQLLIIGRLQPTMLAVMNEIDQNSLALAQSMCKSLQDCAMAFLGHHATLLQLGAQSLEDRACEDVRRLALRLLERAALPGDGARALAAAAYPNAFCDPFSSRSH
jgi:hypothetical protein